MSRLYNYINEAKKMKNTMIGFGIDRSQFKRVQSYIKSWLIKHNIEYETVKDPHFTIAQITGNYTKDELVREINSMDMNVLFRPKDIKVFQGKNIPKDFIVLEYKVNHKFLKAFNDIAAKYEIRYFASVKPHISLFTIEQGVMTTELFEDIKFSMPKLPTVKPKEKQLWNKAFKVEYKT
jgi:hypothetical protein